MPRGRHCRSQAPGGGLGRHYRRILHAKHPRACSMCSIHARRWMFLVMLCSSTATVLQHRTVPHACMRRSGYQAVMGWIALQQLETSGTAALSAGWCRGRGQQQVPAHPSLQKQLEQAARDRQQGEQQVCSQAPAQMWLSPWGCCVAMKHGSCMWQGAAAPAHHATSSRLGAAKPRWYKCTRSCCISKFDDN
jgi:hypothetical protein